MRNVMRNHKKLFTSMAVMGVVATVTTCSCFAEDTTAPAPGALPSGVTDMFSNLGKGIVITIGSIAVIALTVYAAPIAIKFAKKIFNKIAA
jgi:hypothetical protein